jgi:hypothetical protein
VFHLRLYNALIIGRIWKLQYLPDVCLYHTLVIWRLLKHFDMFSVLLRHFYWKLQKQPVVFYPTVRVHYALRALHVRYINFPIARRENY